MATISFGQADTTWLKYNITENPINFQGKTSGYKAIVRNGELVAILSKWYQLLPNEEALRIANEAATLANMQPFNFPKRSGWTPRGNVFHNNRQTRMHAWYAPMGEGAHVWSKGKNGDRIHIGVDVRNSIDGTSSFGCGLFTYREICSNGVILGKQELASITKIHTKGLQPIIKNLKNTMLSIMDKARDVIKSYQRMAELQVTQELIEKIRESALPKKVLPEYLTVEEPQTHVLEVQATEWEVYNDITEKIWHNAEADTPTKDSQFRVLHNVIPLRV